MFGVPLAILQAWFDVSLPESAKPGLDRLLRSLLDNFFTTFSSQILVGCIAYGTVQYLRRAPATGAEAVRHTVSRLGPLIVTSLLFSVFFSLGLVAFVIPGILISCAYGLSTAVAVCEGSSGMSALHRSASLTQGRRWLVFFTSLIVGLIVIGAAMAVGAGIGLAFGDVDRFVPTLIIYITASFLGSLTSALLAVLYVALRENKDGIEIDEVAKVFE